MGTRGQRGVSEGRREAALGVFFVLGSLFLCSGFKVGRVVPNPPLGGGRKSESIEYGVWSIGGERTAGDSRPYLRDGVARWKRLAVGGREHREATRTARGAVPTC
jgi:hypothetical protein